MKRYLIETLDGKCIVGRMFTDDDGTGFVWYHDDLFHVKPLGDGDVWDLNKLEEPGKESSCKQ